MTLTDFLAFGKLRLLQLSLASGSYTRVGPASEEGCDQGVLNLSPGKQSLPDTGATRHRVLTGENSRERGGER